VCVPMDTLCFKQGEHQCKSTTIMHMICIELGNEGKARVSSTMEEAGLAFALRYVADMLERKTQKENPDAVVVDSDSAVPVVRTIHHDGDRGVES
jgi:hypothetical protein